MAYRLRDGSTVQDPRLGRIPQWDERNRQFPVRYLIDTHKRLRSYSWSCYARLDQGNEGSCVGHGLAHELAARPLVIKRVTHEYAVDIYRAAQVIDDWEGEDYEGTSVLAGVKVLTQRGAYTSYHWAEIEYDIATAVGLYGPVIMGTNWHDGMMKTNSFGYIQPTGPVLGGHCWLITGLNVRLDSYTMLNSWGNTWGNNGTAFIKREDVSKLLENGGEACVPVRRRIFLP